MPTYDYLCRDCGTSYDVFHKVREVEADIVCPSCHSGNHQRLLSAPNVTVSNRSEDNAPSCSAGGGCCGGACDVN
jgi:putative FmdB family regulatory protein